MMKRTDPLDQLIGRNIRLYRLRRGLSQTALGDQIGVSFQQVQKYENAANRVPASRLVHIARLLDMPMDAFFGHEAEAVGSPDGDPETRRLMRAVSKITDARLLRLAVRLIEEMAR
jgi:transcriptional regulator with XRE-family HTH domain